MFQPATPTDLAAIAALMNRAYRGAPDAPRGWAMEDAYITGDRTTPALLAEDIAGHPDAFLLKWSPSSDAPISGCVWLEPLGGDVWYLGSLTADPGQQNSGLGRALLAASEAWARDRGAATIRMSVVNVRDTLIAWYERRGYTATGETAPFPYGDNRFGAPLRDDLHFVILEKAV